MIGRNSLEADVSPVKLEAIDWAARFAIGPVSDADRVDFEVWSQSSPAHADAFRVATEFMGELRGLGIPPQPPASGNVVPFRRPGPRVSRRAFVGGSIAASVAAGFVAVQSPLGLWPTLSELMADERTLAGQRRSFSPMAGVDVEMNSRSSVSVIDRGVELVAGEVFVAVESSQPFKVAAAHGTVTASSGHFDVRAYDAEICATCIDGTLTATLGNATHRLAPGDSLTVSPDGTLRRERVDLRLVTAWRRGLLIFEGTPLKSAIAEINRYYPGRLVLRGRNLNERPVTGIFHVDQIELAVVQIQNLTQVSATRLPGGVVLLG